MTSTLLDLSSLMEETLDTIPEAPDYTNPPAGEYRLEVKECTVDKYKTKAKDNQPSVDAQRIKITYAVAETYSTADDEPPVPDGTLFTETFQATEQGLGYFKKRIREIMMVDSTEGTTLGAMMEASKGALFDARISIKKTPKPGVANEFYENIQMRVVSGRDNLPPSK